MGFSGGLIDRDHLHAEFGGALRQRPQHAFMVALLVVVLALAGVLLALGEHRVDQPGQLVSGGQAQGLRARLATRLTPCWP